MTKFNYFFTTFFSNYHSRAKLYRQNRRVNHYKTFFSPFYSFKWLLIFFSVQSRTAGEKKWGNRLMKSRRLKSLFALSIKHCRRKELKFEFERKMKLNAAMLLIVSLWTIWELLKSINFYFLRFINSEIGSVDDVETNLSAITDLHVV